MSAHSKRTEEEEEDAVTEPTGGDGFALTAGDAEIFDLLYQFRMLRREHLSKLTGRPLRRLHRRLLKLIAQKYLTSIRLPQQKHIYALAKRAIPVLVERGAASEALLGERIRVHELQPLFLKHEMMLVDFHVMLALAGNGHALRLVAWQEGRALFDSVNVEDRHGVEKLPVRPDAFFTLEDARRPIGANRAHFFLEADRSSANHTRFKDKLRAYWHYLDQGLHTKKHQIKTFRMLTLTLKSARAQNLCTLAAELLPERARKYYLFGSIEHFSLDAPEPTLESIYLSARNSGSDVRVPLAPAPTDPSPSTSAG